MWKKFLKRRMRVSLIGFACAAVMALGANTIFPPIDANASTIHPMAADPYDPVA